MIFILQSGKIAEELDFVNHLVRSQLDELKRQELERLRQLNRQMMEQQQNGVDPKHLKIAEHIDHTNPHSFEIADLRKLIAKVQKFKNILFNISINLPYINKF